MKRFNAKYAPFWYHPDHLGSSSYITNLDGEINQHMEYLPFGETLVEEHLNSYNSPFKFKAKELDAEIEVRDSLIPIKNNRKTHRRLIANIAVFSILTKGIEILIISRKPQEDRKSTRLNSSHVAISYAVFCLKKKKNKT